MYDGCALIVINGKIKAQGKQFSLEDVEVCTAVVDLEEVRSYRTSVSRNEQAMQSKSYERIDTSFRLSKRSSILDLKIKPSSTLEPRIHRPEEEIGLGAGAYLWDYLRRSRQAGFLVPLSGGIDSCATATIVFSMCRMVMQAIKDGNIQVIDDARRICGEPDSDWLPSSPQEICGRLCKPCPPQTYRVTNVGVLVHTCFMGTGNSSKETRSRAKVLAEKIGAYHTDLDIDTVVKALTNLFETITNFVPRFKVHGGTQTENLAMQNIQARLRMVVAYLFAQMLPLVRKRKGTGSLLVLGSANVDECLRGYLTKYDCSSADINPIGGISKTDLKLYIAYAQEAYDLPILYDFIHAIPTAELEPITEQYVQSDEADMGMTVSLNSQYG